MDPQQIVDTANAYCRCLEARDTAAFVELFSPDVHFEDPVGSRPLHGHEGVAGFHKGVHKAWSKFAIEAEAMFPRGNRVAVKWSAAGHSATGKDISFPGINVIELDDEGKIARLEAYWDFEGVIAQM